jgi:hypothetical protein
MIGVHGTTESFPLIKLYLKCAITIEKVQCDSKLLSGFVWFINGNPDNNLESSFTIMAEGPTEYTSVLFSQNPEVHGGLLFCGA